MSCLQPLGARPLAHALEPRLEPAAGLGLVAERGRTVHERIHGHVAEAEALAVEPLAPCRSRSSRALSPAICARARARMRCGRLALGAPEHHHLGHAPGHRVVRACRRSPRACARARARPASRAAARGSGQRSSMYCEDDRRVEQRDLAVDQRRHLEPRAQLRETPGRASSTSGMRVSKATPFSSSASLTFCA